MEGSSPVSKRGDDEREAKKQKVSSAGEDDSDRFSGKCSGCNRMIPKDRMQYKCGLPFLLNATSDEDSGQLGVDIKSIIAAENGSTPSEQCHARYCYGCQNPERSGKLIWLPRPQFVECCCRALGGFYVFFCPACTENGLKCARCSLCFCEDCRWGGGEYKGKPVCEACQPKCPDEGEEDQEDDDSEEEE